MSEVETKTIIGREEHIGKKYPMILERIFLLIGFILYIVAFPEVVQQFDTKWIGLVAALTILPFFILLTVEVIGRILQRIHNDAN